MCEQFFMQTSNHKSSPVNFLVHYLRKWKKKKEKNLYNFWKYSLNQFLIWWPSAQQNN